MQIANLYEPIYLIIVTLLTFDAMSKYNQSTLSYRIRSYASRQNQTLLIAIILIPIIGLRPHSSVFADTVNYVQAYNYLRGYDYTFSFNEENKIFDNLFSFWAAIDLGIETLFILMATIYFGGVFVACRKMFPQDTLLAYVMYLGAFSTFSFATNGVKAGVAAVIFLIALAYRDKIVLSLLLALVSYGFHHSMQVVVAAYIITLFYKNRKYYLYGWLFCLLMATLHVTFFQEIFASMTDEHGANYLTSGTDEISGFRPDFILYSMVPIFVGYRLESRYNLNSPFYNQILNLYMLINSVWLLCMYATDINRIAYLSWFMYPFVLLYPFVKFNFSHRQSIYLKYVVYGHLGFTLFMFFIYYGLFRS